MRINVYCQELTKEVTVVSQVARDTGITYYGIRLFMHSPDVLSHTEDEDDWSAITFWLPHDKSFTEADLSDVFRRAGRFALELRV